MGAAAAEDTRGRSYHRWPRRAVSSAGRAPALHAGGRRFESCTAHRVMLPTERRCAPLRFSLDEMPRGRVCPRVPDRRARPSCARRERTWGRSPPALTTGSLSPTVAPRARHQQGRGHRSPRRSFPLRVAPVGPSAARSSRARAANEWASDRGACAALPAETRAGPDPDQQAASSLAAWQPRHAMRSPPAQPANLCGRRPEPSFA